MGKGWEQKTYNGLAHLQVGRCIHFVNLILRPDLCAQHLRTATNQIPHEGWRALHARKAAWENGIDAIRATRAFTFLAFDMCRLPRANTRTAARHIDRNEDIRR